jgi:small subunit ribosomal protein S16
MLKIRLSRVGKKNSPIFRLVVAEKTRAVKREYIEILGLYKPTEKENKFQCKKDRIEFWMNRGAQPSETVNNLLCDFGVLAKDKKINIVYGKKLKKKDAKKESTGSDVKVAENVVTDSEEPKETSEQDKSAESKEKVEIDGENNQTEKGGETEENSSEDK